MKIGKKEISNRSKEYYIIAEAGVNHENDFDIAIRLIDLAKEGGADAIKFQTYKAEKLARKTSPAYWDTSKEPTKSQFELFKKYDSFDEKEYRKLFEYSKSLGLDFMSTPFDLESLEFIDPMVNAHKIASADLTNFPLLRAIARKGKPVLMSTGAATMLEVERAVTELQDSGATDIGLLHCVLNYPTPDENAYLERILSLKNFFPDCVIGYSDHTLPGAFCFPVVLGYTFGARVIEKHFTHDKSLPGNDHYHAMDVKDLQELRKKLDSASTLFGSTNEKEFLSTQQAAIKHARRSIVSVGDIAAGSVLSEKNLTIKRPGDGISPIHWDSLIGKKVNQNISDDMPISWNMLDEQ